MLSMISVFTYSDRLTGFPNLNCFQAAPIWWGDIWAESRKVYHVNTNEEGQVGRGNRRRKLSEWENIYCDWYVAWWNVILSFYWRHSKFGTPYSYNFLNFITKFPRVLKMIYNRSKIMMTCLENAQTYFFMAALPLLRGSGVG